MVYGIVKQHGGYINVSSKLGQGTEFTLYFPESELEVYEDKIGYKEEHQESSGVILLVEDSEQVREVTKMLLESVGYDVVATSDAEAGLEKFRQGSEVFDLLLTDLVLPGMNGHDLCLAVRKIRPDIPVIFASGYSEDVLKKSGIQNGEFPSLAKPFSKAALFEMVAREIRKEKK
jgi:two-component system cell cycle sensor histidine kinase/response regulator CckA